MRCPSCQSELRKISYERIVIETCDGCGGEWLDREELGKIIERRNEKFAPDERREIAESTTIEGVVLKDVDRDLNCPKCDGTTDPVNYGGNTGIIIDRCTLCHGVWLDGKELEKIQMVVEGWEDMLPEDLLKYSPKLQDAAEKTDDALDARISHLPLIGVYIDSAINGVLDLADPYSP